MDLPTNNELKVVLIQGDTVGIQINDGYCLFNAHTALEIAQSLINTAIEADPSIDAPAVMEAYRLKQRENYLQHLDS